MYCFMYDFTILETILTFCFSFFHSVLHVVCIVLCTFIFSLSVEVNKNNKCAKFQTDQIQDGRLAAIFLLNLAENQNFHHLCDQ